MGKFAYVYQLTFFVACVAFLGDWGRQDRHRLLPLLSPSSTVVHPEAVSSKPQQHKGSKCEQIVVAVVTIGSDSKQKDVKHTKEQDLNDDEGVRDSLVKVFFHEYYGPFLLHPITKTIAILTLFTYLGIAIFGCFQLKEGLNPSKLVLEDHYVYSYLIRLSDFWLQGPQLHVLVEKPPDFSTDAGRAKVLELIDKLESMPHSMDRRSTMFFYFEYLNYLNDIGAAQPNTTELWYQQFRYWLGSTGGASMWESDIVWTDDDKQLKAFRFDIALRNFLTPNDHKVICRDFRAIANDFKDSLGVTVYHEYFPFADQYLIILSTTLRNVAICMVVMLIVSFLLIPSPPCALLIMASILSITLGVIGYMALWSVNLDCVSMIGLIMSIGFAVDLSAHISYAFVTTPGDNRTRALIALECVGWPIFQGAFSTIIGVLILSTVDAYIIRTFFKTIFLVVFFGMAHGLVFLPVVLSQFLPEHFCGGSDDVDARHDATPSTAPPATNVETPPPITAPPATDVGAAHR